MRFLTLMAVSGLFPAQDAPDDVEQLYAAKQYAQAVQAAEKQLVERPDDAALHHFLGRAVVDAGYNLQSEKAIEHLRRSMRGLPTDHWMLGWSHVYIGMAHEMVGRKSPARDAYELAIALDVTPECTASARDRLRQLSSGAFADTVRQIETLCGQKNYDGVIRLARSVEAGAIEDPLFFHLFGRALVEQGQAADLPEAIKLLERSVVQSDDRRWITGWNHFYLGRAYELSHNLDAARRSFERALAIAATPECVNSARFRLRHLGNDPYADWIEHEMSHVIMLYPPDSPLQRNPAGYGRQLDAAHAAISRFLGVTASRKVRVYLYTDRAQGKAITGADLGWADRDAQVVHQGIEQTRGHELAHCISHYIGPAPYCDSVALNEGLAVYLDQTTRDKHEKAVKLLELNQLPSFTDLERTFRSRDDAYPLGGSFVGFLLERYSRDLFLGMWRDSGNGQLERAFRRHYNKSTDQLSEEWRKYLGGK